MPAPSSWAVAAVLLVGLVAGLVTGCSGDPEATGAASPGGVTDGGEPADPLSEVARPDATVSIDLSVSDDRLLVAYSLTNDGQQQLLVVNQVPETSGADTDYSDDIAYVTGKGRDKVQLAHRAYPLPDSDRADFAQAPEVGSTLVPPGKALNGGVELELPLERRQPFGDDLGYGAISLPDPVRDVEFCLGVIPAPFPESVQPTPDDEDRELMLLEHGDAAHEAQYLFCSDPVAID